MRHTPGPWSVTIDARNTYAGKITAYNKTVDVARVIGYSQEEAEANARLIAAAPDMLELLRVIASQSVGDDWTAEQALAFCRQEARKLYREVTAK